MSEFRDLHEATASVRERLAPPDAAVAPLPPRAIFVVGMPRSGTTLLTRLLDGHPQLFVMRHETHASRCVGAADPAAALLAGSAYGRRGPQLAEDRAFFEALLRARLAAGPADLATLLAGIAGTEFAWRGAPQGCEAWVEKTPNHVRHVPELLAAFGPGTRCIGMVRDPRAVAASRRERFHRTSRSHARHTARRWATVDALTREYLARDRRFLCVTYESLVSDVETVMRRVAQHLHLRWDDALLRPTHAGSAWDGNSSFGGAGRGVNTDSIARWRDELSLREVAQCEASLLPRMLAWGYQPATAVRRGPRLERALVELAAAWHVRRLRRTWPRIAAAP